MPLLIQLDPVALSLFPEHKHSLKALNSASFEWHGWAILKFLAKFPTICYSSMGFFVGKEKAAVHGQAFHN